MEFRIGEITAKCPACTGVEFEASRLYYHGPQAEFRCIECGRTSLYCQLIVQIGDEALKRAKEARGVPA
jgi:transposase-like protein